MLAALEATAVNLKKISTDKLSYTFKAMLLTVLLAAQWPLLMAGVGALLQESLQSTDFSRAVGEVLLRLSVTLFSLRVIKMICLPDGLADAHFKWPESSLSLLRKELHRFTLIAMISAFVAMLSVRVAPVTQGGALAILAFIVLLVALAFFLFQVLNPRRGAFHQFLDRHPKSALTRLRYLWFPEVVGAPLFFAGLAVNGYIYTAGTLLIIMTTTLWLILGLVLIQQFAFRWLLLMHRRLALKAAIDRREVARAQAEEKAREAGEDVPTLSDEGLLSVEEAQVDLDALSVESKKLLNLALGLAGLAGLWFIWSDLLPAFSIFDDVVLWTRSVTVSGVEQLQPVTLVDIAFTLLIIVVTILAIKRLPSFLEIILLQRLDMTPGSRYAAKALVSYTIGTIGILYALQVIGFSWSKVQWLAAALTVGIGFGLQEIVANFISGLIILFERPIRVGDIVTIGDTDGVVTKIQIRATTIRNWDRKELLVPNKEFITSRLLNWSLSDPVTRIIVPVGIAYGSDVQKAMKLMMETAEENDYILDDPKHYVIFTLFGDNSLNLELRAFVGSIDDRLLVISMLHEAINNRFEEAGIVISFPQRDVHLDTTQPLDIRLHHADGELPTIGSTPVRDS
jgi:potassium efflux system protein